MKTTLALALVLAVGACKGKDAAPAAKEQPPAAKPEEKPADKPAEPAVAAPATSATPLDLEGDVTCVGFTAGGKGAYLVTRSKDTEEAMLDVVAVGDATDPKLSSTFKWTDDAGAKKASTDFSAKAGDVLGKQTLTPCTALEKKGETITAKLAGKDVTFSMKGTNLQIAVKGGASIEKEVEGGAASAFVDSAFTSSDSTSVAVVVNGTAEAMSKYMVYWISASDLGK